MFNYNLNGERYINFLESTFVEYLENILLVQNQKMWFHHDGEPPHNRAIIYHLLNGHFPNKWTGNQGVVHWPAKSPNLTPLDFALWCSSY